MKRQYMKLQDGDFLTKVEIRNGLTVKLVQTENDKEISNPILTLEELKQIIAKLEAA